MRLNLLSIILVIFALAVSALAHRNDNCPKSPYFPVAPADLIKAEDLSPADKTFHEKNMRVAIDVTKAINQKFGAAIFSSNGTLMCTGVNTGQTSAILHGEIRAILNCSELYGKTTWEGYYLYTTGEPCPMCSAAIMWAKFDKVIFASYVSNMYCERCFNQLPMDAVEIFKLGYGINKNTVVIGGVLQEETDVFFPSLCSSGSKWGVTPLCQEGWNRDCPRKSRYFGF
ncbi:hypothetical protein RB653_006281 [Dictyostelium firmibasis]|uniref:CMP/dCMP-type deaminase domain-containing protein n=1 Tax=Dictyostelium firmibasis TaxID=79012 RepID=A0AAN7UBS6_9MYCE